MGVNQSEYKDNIKNIQ